jgi:hydroxyacylglutathione hydrolase
MFFRQILHPDLGCASYLLADGGKAAVIDPKWAIEDYLELAAQEGLEIAHILETHNHADHLSGRGRLMEATGATIHVPEGAQVEYEHEPLPDHDTIELGDVRITAFAMPGHRPEHTAYLVEDRTRVDEVWSVLTGDSLFVGDVARPDLAIELEEGARTLFVSLRELMTLDDHVEVWPGHIGGSLCGGAAMSKKPSSTIGFERRFNPFIPLDDEEFVRKLLDETQPQPPNFERIVELNRGPLLTAAARIEPLAPARVDELLGGGALLLDGRAPREYDGAHVEGSINVTTMESAVGTRAAWIADPETPIVVLGPGDVEARRMAELLEAVGFRNLPGYLAGGIAAWQEADLPIETTPAIDPATLADHLRENVAILIDVREDDEWEAGHVPGSIHIAYHDLPKRITDEIRAADKPLAVACSAGNRSSIASGLLRRAGIENLEHVVDGGVPDLEQEGVELEKG